jgi:hypothetical protein
MVCRDGSFQDKPESKIWCEQGRCTRQSAYTREAQLPTAPFRGLPHATGSAGGSDWAIADRLIDFVRSTEVKLRPDERLPLSTEILESSFGLYKQLEGHHNKGGFTSLLASFGALRKPATAESIRRDLSRVSVQAMRTWVKTNLKTTVTSKRNAAYIESTKAA